MRKFKTIPCALTIAGSDSGGGAGVQADLKTFAALEVHGTSVLTCITAQNPKGVLAIEPCSVGIILEQLQAVYSELRPAAVKTGMLYSTKCIEAVAAFLRAHPAPLVVDPVMVATSGARLSKPSSLRSLERDLLPLATLLTPNLAEAEALVGQQLRTVEDLRQAARVLHRQFGCAALVKGGHLRGVKEAVDIFYDGREELLLSAPFVRGVRTHGTGCTYAAAITAGLAGGLSLRRAVCQAKEYITQVIGRTRMTRRHHVLGW